ncbi:unnamed protein product, partial [Iphiclides podalirius]
MKGRRRFPLRGQFDRERHLVSANYDRPDGAETSVGTGIKLNRAGRARSVRPMAPLVIAAPFDCRYDVNSAHMHLFPNCISLRETNNTPSMQNMKPKCDNVGRVVDYAPPHRCGACIGRYVTLLRRGNVGNPSSECGLAFGNSARRGRGACATHGRKWSSETGRPIADRSSCTSSRNPCINPTRSRAACEVFKGPALQPKLAGSSRRSRCGPRAERASVKPPLVAGQRVRSELNALNSASFARLG